jgi:hypothetical protein
VTAVFTRPADGRSSVGPSGNFAIGDDDAVELDPYHVTLPHNTPPIAEDESLDHAKSGDTYAFRPAV